MQGFTMRNLILGATAFALFGVASPLTASAAEYAFCAMGTSTCSEACDFTTLAQCRAFIAGDKGYCQPNPRYSRSASALNFTPRPSR